jgi:hypothetical protein
MQRETIEHVTHKVQLTARATGGGQILIDGRDVSNSVKAITIDVSATGMPRVLLELTAHAVEFEGEGVEVSEDVGQADAEAQAAER